MAVFLSNLYAIFRFWWLSLCHCVTEGVDKHVFYVQLEMSLTVCLQDISRFQFGSFLEVVLVVGNIQLVLFIQISLLCNRYFMMCSIYLEIQSEEWRQLRVHNIPFVSRKSEMSIVVVSTVSPYLHITAHVMTVCVWKHKNNICTGQRCTILSVWNQTKWLMNGVMQSFFIQCG